MTFIASFSYYFYKKLKNTFATAAAAALCLHNYYRKINYSIKYLKI